MRPGLVQLTPAHQCNCEAGSSRPMITLLFEVDAEGHDVDLFIQNSIVKLEFASQSKDPLSGMSTSARPLKL